MGRAILVIGLFFLGTLSLSAAQTTSQLREGQRIWVPEDQPTIQQAIDQASSGACISVRAGVYVESLDFGGKDVWIQGRSGRGTVVLEAPSSAPLVTASQAEPITAGIEGLELRAKGCAIRGLGASMTLRNCLIRPASGASTQGIQWTGGSLRLEEVRFERTSTDGAGGALLAIDAQVVASQCAFIENFGSDGGAVFLLDSFWASDSCLFLNNGAANRGGAMATQSSTNGAESNSLREDVFLGNQADSGGGVFALEASLEVTQCQWSHNVARYGGAIATSGGSTGELSVSRSSFEGNVAVHAGGAVLLGRYEAWLANNIFQNNRVSGEAGGLYANGGGALYLFTGESVVIQHCVFFANEASTTQSDQGSALYVRDSYPSIASSIFWNNQGVPIRVASGFAFVSHSIVEGGFEGQRVFEDDPEFVNPSQGDFRLAPTSIGIDAGDPLEVYAPGEMDFYGGPRVKHCRSDIGIAESDFFADCNGNAIADGCDVALFGAPDLNLNLVPDSCDPDCNQNGIPDDYEIQQRWVIDGDRNLIPDSCQDDCDTNGVADGLEISQSYRWSSRLMAPLDAANPMVIVLPDMPEVEGEVRIRVDARGDLQGADEFVDLELQGVSVGRVFEAIEFADCFPFTTSEWVRIPEAVFNGLAAGSDAVIVLRPSSSVQSGSCPSETYLHLQVFWESKGLVSDCNRNGIPDVCDLSGCSGQPACLDCQGNGVLDECDVGSHWEGESPRLSPLLSGQTLSFGITPLPWALGEVVLEFQSTGDLSTADEWVNVLLNGELLGEVFRVGAKDYPLSPDRDRLVIDAEKWNGLLGQGTQVLSLTTSEWVDDPRASWISFSWSYFGRDIRRDQNQDGVPDECQTRGGASNRRMR